MIDKIKTFFTILLVVIIVFSVIYSIGSMVISALKKPVLLTLDNLEKYKKEATIVTNYNTYYFIEDCFNNFIFGCEQEKYNELYNIYISKYKKQHSKEEVLKKLEEIPAVPENESIDYYVEYNIDTIYSIGEEFILEVNIQNKLYYLIFEIDSLGKQEYDYNFAFLK